MPRVKDRTGQHKERWTFISYVDSNTPNQVARWLCRCDCGTEKILVANTVGKTSRSCGCLKSELAQGRSKHGHTRVGQKKPPEYNSWAGARTRCINPNNTDWDDYGGRGIRMCTRWMASFVDFLADVGRKPGPRNWLVRSDINGHYSCGKCPDCIENGWILNALWSTCKEQQHNKRDNRLLTYGDRTQTMQAWAEELGTDSAKICGRLNSLGWPVEEALGLVPHIHGSTRLTDEDRTIRKAARMSVKNEIKQERLPKIKSQKCIGCDTRADHWHHHLGYSPPNHINVVPVCRSCHEEEHADD